VPWLRRLKAKKVLRMLSSSDGEVRAQGSELLPRVARDLREEELLQALHIPDQTVSQQATACLDEIGWTKRQASAGLRASAPETRMRAAVVVEENGWVPADGPENAAYLAAKQDWDGCVRLGDEAVDALVSILGNSWGNVRLEIIKTLGEIRSPRCVEPLMRELRRALGTEWGTVERALASLGTLAVQPLVDLGETVWREATDDKSPWGALRALAQITDPLAVEQLHMALKSECNEVRKAAANALGSVCQPCSVAPILTAMKDETEHNVQRALAEAAVRLAGSGECGSRLQEVLEEQPSILDPWINGLAMSSTSSDPSAQHVAQFLGMIGARRATYALVDALGHHHGDVRSAAAEALQQLGWVPKDERQRVISAIAGDDRQSLRRCPHSVDILLDMLEKGSHPEDAILSGLGMLGNERARRALFNIMCGQGPHCSHARDLLNSGRPSSDEHVLCPDCRKYLGIRKKLAARGSSISRKRKKARRRGETVLRPSTYPCPACGAIVIVS